MIDPSVYKVGWICALPVEYVAARELLDEEHDKTEYVSPLYDDNTYTFGRIGKHYIIVAVTHDGEYGTSSAARVAYNIVRSFPALEIGLMVGIGGGAPSRSHDIRLGDVVVSSSKPGKVGVLQYDFERTIQEQKFHPTGHLFLPPTRLLTAVANLRARIEADGHQLDETIEAVLLEKPKLRKKYELPGVRTDRLHSATFVHPDGKKTCGATCFPLMGDVCYRDPRTFDENEPVIHYGLIASGGQLMQDATIRDELTNETNVLCFEMEAAGVINQFPFLVIRGICDYADSHKNETWQGYAAMTAAAYAKRLLSEVAPCRADGEMTLGKILQIVEQSVVHVHATVDELEEEEVKEDDQCDPLQSWLSAPNLSAMHERAAKQKHPDTGQWFLQSDAYTRFKQGEDRFLWLHGNPGCGKTILASSVIDDLHESTASPDAVVYFYFDFNDSTMQTLEDMVRSLVNQLSKQSDDALKELKTLHTKCDHGQKQPTFPKLDATWEKMIDCSGRVIIVLDGLDESTTRDVLLGWIGCYFVRPDRLQCILFSREEQDIHSTFSRRCRPELMVPLSRDKIDIDIRSYLRSRLREDEGFIPWRNDANVLGEIETKLLQNPHATFLWISYSLDALKQCLSYPQIQFALESLPNDLEGTYAKILKSIPRVYRRDSIRLLQFLVWSDTPLELKEAVDAMAVRIDKNPHFDSHDRMPNPNDIFKLCSSLVTTTTVEDKQNPPRRKTELRLAHFSIKEYLACERVSNTYKKHLEKPVAKVCMAKVALAYLLSLREVIPLREIEKRYPLARYAAKNWHIHALSAVSEDVELHTLGVELLDEDSVPYHNWSKLFTPHWQKLVGSQEALPEPVYFASMMGLEAIAEILIGWGADFDAPGPDGRNALQLAASSGHFAVVHMMIDSGADVDAPDGCYETALIAATVKGYVEIVRLLVDNGAVVNREGEGNSALCLALSRDHMEIAKILIRNGANVYAGLRGFGTALQIASRRGNVEVVKMLIDRMQDINADRTGSGRSGTALQEASSRGHFDVVRELTSRGARINDRENDSETALQLAIAHGHTDVARSLILRGADVNAPGPANGPMGILEGNALYTAASLGYTETVHHLIRAGADVNCRGGEHGSPLQAAIAEGHTRTAESLVANGASNKRQQRTFQHT